MINISTYIQYTFRSEKETNMCSSENNRLKNVAEVGGDVMALPETITLKTEK